MFDVPVAFPGRCGDVQTSIPFGNEHLLWPVRFIRALCVFRGKNALVFLTTDFTDFADKIVR